MKPRWVSIAEIIEEGQPLKPTADSLWPDLLADNRSLKRERR